MLDRHMLRPVDDHVLARLRADLPEKVFGADQAPYLEDPRRILSGKAAAVLRPSNVDEVSKIVRFANEARVGIVPYGGGTGLVGGQVFPDEPAPLVVSLERMNNLRAAYPSENVLVVEAGMTLADVQTSAAEVDRLFPLSLASEGTARIGGNLSTNAGGVQVLRYGNARDLCLGIEAVLPSGEIFNGLRRLRKDNTGYDLRNLLIGAEGTLGIITAASLRLFPIPGSISTALFSVSNPEAAVELLSIAQDKCGSGLTAFELIHGQGMDFLSETGLPGGDMISPRPDWSVLIEVALPEAFDSEALLAELFEAGLEKELVSDGILAQSEDQRDRLWQMRESIPEGNRRIGAVVSHDVSVPISEIPRTIEDGQALLARIGDFRANIFGHIGDGNLHFNVFPPKGGSRDDYRHLANDITEALHDLVDELGGSFSAEHGLGRFKVGEMERLGDPTKLQTMRAIKKALDPNGIMNPGAVLRSEQISS